jgi:hypothetical protein
MLNKYILVLLIVNLTIFAGNKSSKVVPQKPCSIKQEIEFRNL